MSIRIPSSWNVAVAAKKDAKENETHYKLHDDGNSEVFEILVVDGGPEWIGCFCAPHSKYEYTEKKPYKVWAFSLKLSKLETRTVKVANERLRLDIHATIPEENSDRVRYIAESA